MEAGRHAAAPAPIRMLVLMDTAIVSGPLRQLVASLEDLARLHVSAHVMLTTRTGHDVRAVCAYLDAHHIAYTHVEARHRFDRGALAVYRAALRSGDYDVLQTHGYRPTVMGYLLRRAGARRIPWVSFFHGRTYESLAVRLFDRLAIRCARAADLIVVVAERHRALFAAAATRTEHVPNAVTVPVRAATPVPATVRADVPPARRLVCIGRLSPEKGVDVLLDAVAQLHTQGESVPVVIVGDGPERARLTAQAHTRQLGAAVHFAGHHADASAFYTPDSVVCIPSRSEGMPNVLLEALAAGLPVVATRVGDIPEMLDDPALGVLVAPEDPVRFAEAVRQVLAWPAHHAADAGYVAARERVLDRYSRARRASRLRALYARAVDAVAHG